MATTKGDDPDMRRRVIDELVQRGAGKNRPRPLPRPREPRERPSKDKPT